MSTDSPNPSQQTSEMESVVIRFSGDSGDGMQLTGTQFSNTTAVVGNDLATFPDYPAEIRAPAGTTFGVSGFQINFASKNIYTPGDYPDALIAMNPAALKVNLEELKENGLLIVNKDAFTKHNLAKAGYDKNPLEDDSLSRYRLHAIDVTTRVATALEDSGLTFKEIQRAKNFWTLGLVYYLYNRPLEPSLRFIEQKFMRKPAIAAGNRTALKAGYLYGENAELFQETYKVKPAELAQGTYRNINGNVATAWGVLAAAERANIPAFYAGYPITPASDILHELSRHREMGITTFQAEDEIAAICAAIGAAFAGSLAVTASSGPGIALKGEAIGLAISVELPLLIINVQRGGPSTGLPTKTEQADLFQAYYGRNGEAPCPIVAAHSPSDCFEAAIEASRIALKYMVPCFLLTDGYLANSAEPWRIPNDDELPKVEATYWTETADFSPFHRDPKTLARAWAVPGTPGLEHRIGGIERDYDSGNISYDPQNHERMTETRQEKVDRIAEDIPVLAPYGAKDGGDVLILGWGSTFGVIRQAVLILRSQGVDASHAHLRHLMPFPKNLQSVLTSYKKVIVPEVNAGHLATILRSTFLLPVESYTKIQGRPFKVEEIVTHTKQVSNGGGEGARDG